MQNRPTTANVLTAEQRQQLEGFPAVEGEAGDEHALAVVHPPEQPEPAAARARDSSEPHTTTRMPKARP